MTTFRETAFIIPIFDQWLLYFPLHKCCTLCGEGLLHMLPDELPQGVSGKLGMLFDRLEQDPIIVMPVENKTLRPQFLGMIPTRACNLACKYCAFGLESEKQVNMDEQLAIKTVDWIGEILRSQKRKLFAVDFFGGEPTVALPVVKTTVGRVREVCKVYKMEPRFEMATNGFYDEDVCQFLCDNIDFITLSFDGPEEIQNFHRPTKNGSGSFDIVYKNAKKIVASKANLTIRICVTNSTINQLDEIVDWFCREFHPSSLNVEPLRETAMSGQVGIHPPSPHDFVRMVQRSKRVAATYNIPLIYAAADLHELRSTFCPMGKDVPIVFPDGSANSCYMQPKDWRMINFEMCFGQISPMNKGISLDYSRLNVIRQHAEHHRVCHSCFCRWNCAGGCFMDLHSSPRKDGQENFCTQTRILTACNLLDQLGRSDLSDQLASDREAQSRVNLRRSDLLQDFPKPN